MVIYAILKCGYLPTLKINSKFFVNSKIDNSFKFMYSKNFYAF